VGRFWRHTVDYTSDDDNDFSAAVLRRTACASERMLLTIFKLLALIEFN